MIIVCIESKDILLRDQIIEAVAQQLRTSDMRVRVASFPGDGPFAHQIRVSLDQRTQYHELPWHGLQLVDRMDFFMNPTNGLISNTNKVDYLLISGSQFLECLQATDDSLGSWILSINAILPQPQWVFWISNTEHDPAFERLSRFHPSAHRITAASVGDMVNTICVAIQAEGDHE